MTELRLIRPDGPDSGGRSDLGALHDELLRLARDSEASATAVVERILDQAVAHRASDVHFEPWEDGLAVRYRIDGLLHDVALIPGALQPRIVARIKVLGKMVSYEKDRPQDGRIDGAAIPGEQAARVSTIPTVHGEKAVLRLLGAHRELLPLTDLGFDPETVDRLRSCLDRPQGTMLLTGPSSSGKTTTIYALLRELQETRRASTNIVTIEDPVEYRMNRISQIQVAPHQDLDYQAALRTVLRQDPEVIVVGEIRDAETARIAIQAGLTGHLVISTIHSGTAPGVFARLLDMGIEPFLVASSVTAVLAQRLLRITCPACKAPYMPEPVGCKRFGLAADGPWQRGAGCEACRWIGYHGRSAIGELLPMSDALSDRILARARTRRLHETAVAQGMRSLAEDGAERVRQGVTTVEELQRVVPLPGDDA